MAKSVLLATCLAYTTEAFVTCFASDDKREGVAAFLEKRPAEFTGGDPPVVSAWILATSSAG